MFENVMAEDDLKINAKIKTEAAIEKRDKFIENHQQACSKRER
jgi:hypothetical protein